MIKTFSISHFRNIISTDIDCDTRFNLFFGDNAAGKTSILEAIYYLSTGKSFRTHSHSHIIHNQQNALTLFAQIQSSNEIIPIGMQRNRDGGLSIRLNGESIRSVAESSRHLPVQFIGSDSHRILNDGPKNRRRFLDWGLFHVKHSFFQAWKTFQNVLAQRNAALKARASKNELATWNQAFAAAGETLHVMRKAYFEDFKPVFDEMMREFLPETMISIDYHCGWDDYPDLLTCLERNVSRETMVGHSLFGPQRADLVIQANQVQAEDNLSQGQQKLVAYALQLAQGLHLQLSTNKNPIYLIDDLPSELDLQKRKLVTKVLRQIEAQVFITGILPDDLETMAIELNSSKMFHVKQGRITEKSEKKCFT